MSHFIIRAAALVAVGGSALVATNARAALGPIEHTGFKVIPAHPGKAQLPQIVPLAPLAQSDTNDIIVFLKPGTDISAIVNSQGLTNAVQLGSDDAWKVSARSIAEAAAITDRLNQAGVVLSAEVDRITQRATFAFTPNDPLYGPGTTASTGGQWHLRNTANPGRDVNVVPAWNRNITGAGVTIGIVDDGLERTHPDLAPNYSAADSRDFVSNDSDPSPGTSDFHGTAVAGVAAARGGNGIGVTGAAPNAQLAGLRVGFGGAGTTSQFVNATTYRSSGATAIIDVKNHSYGYSAAYITATSEVNAVVTSATAGTIHVFAAGNNRGFSAQDVNHQDTQNNPEVIAVAALSSGGRWSYYSNFGAALFVTTPSNGATGNGSGSSSPGITTTDRVGSTGYGGLSDSNYTNSFGGTSSAAPLAAGVMALLK